MRLGPVASVVCPVLLISMVTGQTALPEGNQEQDETAASACPVTVGEAQTQPPFEFSQVSAYTWQGKNVAFKEILAYVIKFEGPPPATLAHDYYFKPKGIAPGAIEVFGQVNESKPGTVLWVQYVDGTEWGDRQAASKLLQSREPMLRMIAEMVSAYSHGGEKEFTAYLESNKERDTFVKYIWIMQHQSGTEGATDHLKIRLDSAAKHDKMLEESNRHTLAARQRGKLCRSIDRHLSTDFLGWSGQ